MSYLVVKNKHVSISPRKMLLVADLIRRKELISSLDYLKNSTQKSSKIFYKILSGAYNQLLNDNKLKEDFLQKKVYIDTIKVDKGIIKKKIFFRAKGRADTIRQRKCHITLTLLAK